MLAAREPRNDELAVRLLVLDELGLHDSAIELLHEYLRPGDLLVVNDAATIPASLHGRDRSGNPLEVRLTLQLDERTWRAVLFGAGDWRIATEERPRPPRLRAGDEISFSEDFKASVVRESGLSGRLLDLEFNVGGAQLWRGIYALGRPVQYSYMKSELDLWSVQNVYGGRPWAVEMPSAGHAFNWRLLLSLREHGVQIASLTHGAGLSSTGDPEIDRDLPMAERFEIPAATMQAVEETRARGGRVIAVGTSVVRALESYGNELVGLTELKIGAGYRLKKVDGLITGTHEVSESHYQLLRAFVSDSTLARISAFVEGHNYLTHEFGDLCLISAEC
ncbi:MAG TPA: S-adenosylmethionine:tRNA ribosyltransferase-isomerase [Blastocatellia bacterium]|nr:S-adenosylmethionine:tRNA ribosyltransferase-isomerase [Blastocatellia bacterium]